MKGFTSIVLFLFIFLGYLFSNISTAQPVQQEWVSRYPRPQNSGGFKNFIGLDKFGNIYVCGQVYNNNTYSDIVLIKYNSNGDTVWTRVYNNPSNTDDMPYAFAVDSVGNAYVTGTQGFGTKYMQTIKYNPSGNLQWASVYTGPGNAFSGGNDIKLDNSGNVYVAGTVGPLQKAVTIKYNSIGDSQWVKLTQLTGYRYYGQNICLKNGFVFTGIIRENINTNLDGFLVVKYDINGNEQWTTLHDNNSGFDDLRGLAVDNAGNSFITGMFNPGNYNYITIKFSSAGVEQWMRFYNGTGNGSDEPFAIVSDNQGNIYVTGYSSGTELNADYLTVKYDTNGDSIWVNRYNGSGNANDESYAIALDDSSNSYITGRSTGSSTNWDYATIKYNINGIQQWVVRYNGSANASDLGYSIAVDEQGNIYVTGESDRGGFLYDYATIKYSQPLGIEPVMNNTPVDFCLYQNYPNPFNSSTNFKVQISKSSQVEIKIYDITGKEVNRVFKGIMKPGLYEINWDADRYNSGVYFYQLESEGKIFDTKKMILLK